MESEYSAEFLEGLSKNEYRMATQPLKGLVLKSSIPPIIGMLVGAMYNLADRYWVGKMGEEVGKTALTAIGISMPMTFVLLGLAQLVGIGAVTCISISLGKKEVNEAERILGSDLFFSVALSVVYTALVLMFREPLLQLLFGNSMAELLKTQPQTLQFASDYITIITAGSIFQMVSFTMNHPIRGTGNSTRFATTQLLGAIVNIVLDPIFIFVFHMGIRGAAYATILAQCISMIWVLTYYRSPQSKLRIRAKYIKPDWRIAGKMFSIGVSPFIMQVVASLVLILINGSLMYYGTLELGDGETAIAAMTIVNGIFTFFFMPILGINQGVQPIVGFNFGAGSYERVKQAYRWGTTYEVIICWVGFLMVQLLSAQFITAFNDDASVVAFGSYAIKIYFFCMLLVGFQVSSINFLQSIHRAKISILLSMLRQVFLLVPLYIFMPRWFGLTGIIVSVPIAEVISSIFTLIFIVQEFKLLKIQLQTNAYEVPSVADAIE